MVNRGELLAFAVDMLILTNSKAEMAQAIQELDNLSGAWNLRLKKAKSQVLTPAEPPNDGVQKECGHERKFSQ